MACSGRRTSIQSYELSSAATGFFTRCTGDGGLLRSNPTCCAGLIGPFVLGALKHSRGDYTAASAFLALVMAFGATVAFVMLPIVSDDATLQPVKVQNILLRKTMNIPSLLGGCQFRVSPA